MQNKELDFCFCADLILVKIFENPTINDEPPWFDVFKFRPDADSNVIHIDTTDLSGWKTPKDGRMQSIRFYAT